MQLHVRFINGKHPNVNQEMLENILMWQLVRFQHRLKHVQLYIEDVNGPRGGVDKHCRCVLHLRRMAPVVIRDSDSNIPAMIHRVADRASFALSRQAARRITSRVDHRRSSKSTGEASGASPLI